MGGRVWVAAWMVVWSQQPPSPNPFLSGCSEVHGVDSESTTFISRNGKVVQSGSRCCGERWSSGAADVHVNGGGGVAYVGVSSAWS
jgi:hypothetical protein